MPADHDLEPGVMGDEEKRQRRRFDAAFVFEQMPPMASRAQFGTGGDPLRVFHLDD